MAQSGFAVALMIVVFVLLLITIKVLAWGVLGVGVLRMLGTREPGESVE